MLIYTSPITNFVCALLVKVFFCWFEAAAVFFLVLDAIDIGPVQNRGDEDSETKNPRKYIITRTTMPHL